MVAVADIFDDLIGHAHVIDLLRSEVLNPAQAYLFVGPASTGKASAARRFAAALLCSDDSECARRVMAGVHPDVVLVEPAGRRFITVDQARTTIAQASLAPLEGSRKVFLFEEGGLMNDEAANALLKTLEEPTRSTIFLLVAEADDELPETVASRCRKIVFGRVSEEEVGDGLVRLGIEPEQAHRGASPDDPDYWRQCLEVLRNLKVVDPACGSGAFLFQAYDTLDLRYREVIGHLDAATVIDER